MVDPGHISHLRRPIPAWGIFVLLFLVKVDLVSKFEIEVTGVHSRSCIYGSAQTCCSRAFYHGLDADFPQAVCVFNEAGEGLFATVRFLDLINTGQHTRNAPINSVIGRGVVDREKGVAAEYRLT